jgi:hypothetical protein
MNNTTLKVKTTSKNVKESNEGLFNATMNLPEAATHCGMTNREMKHIFWEYLKYNPPTYASSKSDHDTQPSKPFVSILDETEGSI